MGVTSFPQFPFQALEARIGVQAPNAAEIAGEIRRLAPRIEVFDGADASGVANETQLEALVTWVVDRSQIARMRGLRLVQANGAGVDGILPALDGLASSLATPSDRQPPVVCRTVDPSLTDGMRAYVAWAVLDHLREMDHYRSAQRSGRWAPRATPSTGAHRVGVAGAGELGQACLRALADLGLATRAWSRTPKTALDPRTRHFAGPGALPEFLSGCDTLVCLLPLTAETRGFLGRPVFDALPGGAHVVNVGRGAHLVEADLLAALRSGRLARATLDVTQVEPLPFSHPLWTCPGVVLTPHIAARASAASVAAQTLGNLLALREGRPPRNRVDINLGY